MFPYVSDLRLRVLRLLTALLRCAVRADGTRFPPRQGRTSGPKYGGTLVVGLTGGEPDSLDPTVSRGLGDRYLPGDLPAALQARAQPREGRAGARARRSAAGPVEGQAQLHGPAAQGRPVQRRHAVQRAGGRHHGPALHDLSRLVARDRLRIGRQRHGDRPVHGRLPPEGAGLGVRRHHVVHPVADGARQARVRASPQTRSAQARSCSTTGSSATT